MALITQIQLSSESAPTDVLMVSYAVGTNAPNWWTDIQLVQYMIGSIYIYQSAGVGEWGQSMTPAELNALPDPNKDFKALKRTADLITRFQQDAIKETGTPIYVDGRVDRAYQVKSTLSATYYTILVANYYLSSAVRASEGTDNWIGHVVNDPDLPALVKAQLTV